MTSSNTTKNTEYNNKSQHLTLFSKTGLRKRKIEPLFKGKNLTNGFWAEAVNTATYLKNRSPTKCLDYKTPFEALFGFKPAVSHVRVFGCKAFAHVPKEDSKKLDSKAIKCTFVGYCSEFKAYKLFNPSTHKVFASQDVVFHE